MLFAMEHAHWFIAVTKAELKGYFNAVRRR